jgi:hypothetical protein
MVIRMRDAGGGVFSPQRFLEKAVEISVMFPPTVMSMVGAGGEACMRDRWGGRTWQYDGLRLISSWAHMV